MDDFTINKTLDSMAIGLAAWNQVDDDGPSVVDLYGSFDAKEAPGVVCQKSNFDQLVSEVDVRGESELRITFRKDVERQDCIDFVDRLRPAPSFRAQEAF